MCLSLQLIQLCLQFRQESRERHAVDEAMIAAQRNPDRMSQVQSAVNHDWSLLDRADGGDCDLRRIDHGSELINLLDHAEIADREGAAARLFRLESSLARPLNQVSAAIRQFASNHIVALGG